jgi:hypothetical protein
MMQPEEIQNKNANNKVDAMYKIWLGIRDDYRTLIKFEGVNVVNKSDELDEEDGDE